MRWMALMATLLPTLAMAEPVRDLDTPIFPVPGYDKARLLGDWYELAQAPTFLERDCHGTTAAVATREDTRLTLKIACHMGNTAGKVLPIEGIMVQTDQGIFELRLVRLLELGNISLVVLWQAPDDSLVALGAPSGEIGWVWSRSLTPDPALLQKARQALIDAGYQAKAIRSVDQGL